MADASGKPGLRNADDFPGGTKGDLPVSVEVLRRRAQFAELTGAQAESVTSLERTDGGWKLEREVVELLRVPDTMSLRATYEMTLDPYGVLTGYRHVRRYEREEPTAGRPHPAPRMVRVAHPDQ